jgi:hypothetical protein
MFTGDDITNQILIENWQNSRESGERRKNNTWQSVILGHVDTGMPG